MYLYLTDMEGGQKSYKGLQVIMIQFSLFLMYICLGLPWWISSKESACNVGDTGDAGWIPALENPLAEPGGLWFKSLRDWGCKESDAT